MAVAAAVVVVSVVLFVGDGIVVVGSAVVVWVGRD